MERKKKKKVKELSSVCLERARVSYRAGAKEGFLKKTKNKTTIINCHLHLKCEARERALEDARRRTEGTLFAQEVIQ